MRLDAIEVYWQDATGEDHVHRIGPERGTVEVVLRIDAGPTTTASAELLAKYAAAEYGFGEPQGVKLP